MSFLTPRHTHPTTKPRSSKRGLRFRLPVATGYSHARDSSHLSCSGSSTVALGATSRDALRIQCRGQSSPRPAGDPETRPSLQPKTLLPSTFVRSSANQFLHLTQPFAICLTTVACRPPGWTRRYSWIARPRCSEFVLLKASIL